MPELLDRPSEYKQNSPERKLCISVRRIQLRKAGYEGESLADVAKARRIARRGMLHARDADTFVKYSRELERWIERERVLLRIPLPQAAKAPEPRRVSSSVNYTELPRSAPAVMDESTNASVNDTGVPSGPGPGPGPTAGH